MALGVAAAIEFNNIVVFFAVAFGGILTVGALVGVIQREAANDAQKKHALVEETKQRLQRQHLSRNDVIVRFGTLKKFGLMPEDPQKYAA